jgi:hypothetical protein
MRIQASTRKRGGGDVRDDAGVGRLALTADNNSEREFMTSVFRIVGAPDRNTQDKGIAWMREYLKSFPPFETEALDAPATPGIQ